MTNDDLAPKARPPLAIAVPDRPALEGLEDRWARQWDEDGIYAFDRSKSRGEVFSIDILHRQK